MTKRRKRHTPEQIVKKLRNTTRKSSLRAKRLIAGWDEAFLEELLSGK